MQDFYLTPLPTIIIISSLFIICTILAFYYMYSKTIVNIYRFKVLANIESLVNLLKNSQSYPKWWKKFKKLYIYHVDVEHVYDDNVMDAKLILYVHTNIAKETWHIFLKTHPSKKTFIIVTQEISLLSKIKKVTYSTIFYKKDLINFKKDLLHYFSKNYLRK